MHDPVLAELLSPKQAFGCKRRCLDTGYLETFNLPYVHVVDVNHSPIVHLTEKGLLAGGHSFEFDCIIRATGSDAMAGAVLRVDLRGDTVDL